MEEIMDLIENLRREVVKGTAGTGQILAELNTIHTLLRNGNFVSYDNSIMYEDRKEPEGTDSYFFNDNELVNDDWWEDDLTEDPIDDLY